MKRLLAILSLSALLSLLLFVPPANATLATVNCEGDSHTFEYTLTTVSGWSYKKINISGFNHDLNVENASHTDTDYDYYVQYYRDGAWHNFAIFYGPITPVAHGPHYHSWDLPSTTFNNKVRFKVWQKHIKTGWPDNVGTCYSTTINAV